MKTESEILLTPEQEDIAAVVAARTNSLVVQAGPGCGKTFTNVQTMLRGGHGYKLALAFNKSIADELRVRAPSGIDVKTAHSAGLQMMKQKFRSQVNSRGVWNKESKAYKAVQSTFPTKFADSFGQIASALVSGIDRFGFGADPDADPTPEEWKEALDDIPLSSDERLQVAQRLPITLEQYLGETSEIGFPEMLVSPLRYSLSPPFPMNQIWGDEIQDWSMTQLRMTQLLTGEHTLLYGFGDKFQSIYAFRGADIHAMRNFKEMFSAIEFPLNRSFRCPQSVIELARNRNPNLTCPSDAEEGSIEYLGKDFIIQPSHLTSIPEGTMILCRVNAPLFSIGLRFLAKGQPVRISSNLGATLERTIKSLKTKDIKIFSERLEIWYRDQLEFAGDSRHLAGAANDKYSTLKALASGASDVDDMIKRIHDLTRSSSGPLLSTVHKAKGLEARRVILACSHLLTFPGDEPYRSGSTEEDCEQEWNIWFVAVTRSMDELWFA